MLILPQLQNELRDRFNPDGSDLRNLQLKLVEMLKYIDDICQRENIPYWLAYGNVLGLVRHGGFIPWDDDIDIELLREDYLRLRNAIINDDNAPFRWQDTTTDKYYYMHFAKLRDINSEVKEPNTEHYEMRGIYIDIFQLDRSTCFMTKYSTFARAFIETFFWSKVPKTRQKSGIKYIKFFFNKILFPFCTFINWPFRKKQLIFHYPSSVVGALSPHSLKSIFPIKRANFEGIEVNIPGNPEEYLREIYGEWQEIPPIDKIHIHFAPNHIKFYV